MSCCFIDCRVISIYTSLPGVSGSLKLYHIVVLNAVTPKRGSMSTPAQISEVEATPQMSHTNDTQPPTTGADTDSNAPTETGVTVAVADDGGSAMTAEEQITSKQQRVGKQLIDNPVQAFFGAVIVALLAFTLTSINARIDDINTSINDRIDDINDRIDDINDRIDDINDRITRLEEEIDTRFTALEKDVAEINLKLTALITAFNVAPEITAAQEGRIISDTQNANDESD